MNNSYDDIIMMPHHVSSTRKRMSAHDRAAQFSSFAALTGHEDAIKETARLTDRRIELDDYEKAEIDRKLALLKQNINNQPEVYVVYFEIDEKKEGGSYIEFNGNLKKIDEYNRVLVMTNNTSIEVNNIVELEII